MVSPWLCGSACQVSYCMRNHQVQRYHADFEELHDQLCTELIIMPCFPEGGGVASLVGTCSYFAFFSSRIIRPSFDRNLSVVQIDFDVSTSR